MGQSRQNELNMGQSRNNHQTVGQNINSPVQLKNVADKLVNEQL